MKKFSFLILIIFCLMSNPVSASTAQLQEYLAKLIPPIDTSSRQAFAGRSMAASEQVWLDQVDEIFESANLSKQEANFALGFARDGSINSMSLISCAEDMSEADFKSLVAKLMAIRVPSLPGTIAADTFFMLDANWFYLDRPIQEPIAMNASFSDSAAGENDFEQIFRLISANASIDAVLEYPNFVDYPYIGELIKFRLKSQPQVLLKGYVNKLNNDYVQIKIEEISNTNNKLITDLSFKVERPSIEFHDLSAKMLETAISSAASAGLAGAVLTNGIMPGAFAVLGAGAVLAQERVEEKPFYLSKGDEVVLQIGGDTNERNIDLWSISSGDNWSVSTSNPGFAD